MRSLTDNLVQVNEPEHRYNHADITALIAGGLPVVTYFCTRLKYSK